MDALRHIQKTAHILPVIILKFYGSGGRVKSRKELMNSFCVTNKVVVGSKSGTCRTTCSLKGSIPRYTRASLL